LCSIPQAPDSVKTIRDAYERGSGRIGCCGSCIDARGISWAMLIEGVRRSSMPELAEPTPWAEKVLTF
jgi:uncharacterized protein involved in oxidation of intracellular sulfur